ncbi:MAG: hypothetical protein NC131_02815 [Roseburia sp.]|nr:hypothetical protein [Roseburia sp.]
MKRLTVILLSILLILPSALVGNAYAAAPSYARAANERAYLCRDKSETTSLFAVPYTYCIEVLRDEGDWYYARYGGDTGVFKPVYGYCKKQDFTPEATEPAVIWLYKTVTVTYKADVNVANLPSPNEISVEAAYYGYYEAGGAFYSYVYCQGDLCYIEGKNDDYEPNTPAFSGGGNAPAEEGANTASAGLSFGAIAFIVIASLAVVVILIIYFTTKKPKIDG